MLSVCPTSNKADLLEYVDSYVPLFYGLDQFSKGWQ